MRTSSRFALSLVVVATLLVVATPATGDDMEEARKHFAEGVKRYKDGDYEGARALFQQANTEHHAAPIVYNIARAEERLGHPQAAVDAYDAYIAEAGEKGELTEAAIVAVARIRASARQLHIQSKPAGARIFIDGTEARDPAPTRVLVPAGRHHIVAEGDGWRAEADVETGPSPTETVTLAQPEPSSAAKAASPIDTGNAPPTASSIAPPVPPPLPSSDGFVFGAQFAAVPHYFDKTASKPFTSFGLAAGFVVEAGYAPAEDLVAMGRILVAAGSKGSPATVLDSIGFALSYRLRQRLWIGGALQIGRALLPGAFNPGPDDDRRFDSDFVFCPTLELSVAVIERSYGQWLISIFPGYYFASPRDNDVLYVPVGFGLRTF